MTHRDIDLLLGKAVQPRIFIGARYEILSQPYQSNLHTKNLRCSVIVESESASFRHLIFMIDGGYSRDHCVAPRRDAPAVCGGALSPCGDVPTVPAAPAAAAAAFDPGPFCTVDAACVLAVAKVAGAAIGGGTGIGGGFGGDEKSAPMNRPFVLQVLF